MIKKILKNYILWSWFSRIPRILQTLFIIPSILTIFSPSEISYWFLLNIIFSLYPLCFLGTQTHIIKYISILKGSKEQSFIKQSLKAVYTLCFFYKRMSLVGLILAAIFGYLSLMKPIAAIENNDWHEQLSFLIVLIAFFVNAYFYPAYLLLNGYNKILIITKVQSLVNICSLIFTVLSLLIFKTLLSLVISVYFWIILLPLIFHYFARYRLIKRPFSGKYSISLVKEIWSPSWRSAISFIFQNTTQHISGIIFANIGSSSSSSTYLLTLKIINVIRDIVAVPFMLHIPLYGIKMVSKGKQSFYKVIGKDSVFIYLLVLFSFTSLFFFGNELLNLINSNVSFIDPLSWTIFLMTEVFIFYMMFHNMIILQLKNIVISHKVNFFYGIVYLALSFFFVEKYGIIGFPIASLIAQVLYPVPYITYKSYKASQLNFFTFEKNKLIPSILFVFLLFCYSIFFL